MACRIDCFHLCLLYSAWYWVVEGIAESNMQPTPPKSKKPGYRRPFYDAGKKTSAEIVSEARSTVKVLETSRPYTPIENNRRLFGSAYRPSDGRPPSVFRYNQCCLIGQH